MIIYGIKLHEGSYPGHYQEFIYFTTNKEVADIIVDNLMDKDTRGKWDPTFKVHEVDVEEEITDNQLTRRINKMVKKYLGKKNGKKD